ncbi:MAG: hypothetical protein Q9171_006833, partial [Xanthocarpia ochracea]
DLTFIDALQSGLGLQGLAIGEVESSLLKAIDEAKAKSTRIVLVLDGVDFLLAATEATVEDVLDSISELREHVHTTIISASADYPLIQTQHSPLELKHAGFVMSIAHEAQVIWGVRELDTGSARDVSGVLRITRGPVTDGTSREDVEERELLYFVAGDGGVRLTATLIHNEYVNWRDKEVVQWLIFDDSEGYFVLWQAPQQIPYSVQTLRSSFPPHPKAHLLIMRLSRGQNPSMCVFRHPPSCLRIISRKTHNWGMKAKRRKTTGTGRMRTMKEIPRKFKNGFQIGTPKGSKGPATNA